VKDELGKDSDYVIVHRNDLKQRNFEPGGMITYRPYHERKLLPWWFVAFWSAVSIVGFVVAYRIWK
jgi:hypothetical protein